MALDLRGGNSILGLMGHIQQQGELGRQEGNRRGLAGLLSKGMTANPMQQREMLARGAAIDPEGTQKVAGLFKQQNDDALDHFGKLSAAAAASGGDPHMLRQWAQAGAQIWMLPPEVLQKDFSDPADIQGASKAVQSFAQAFGGAGAPEQFTLGPGSKRFAPDGSVVAEVPFAPQKPEYVFQTDAQGNGFWIPKPTGMPQAPTAGAPAPTTGGGGQVMDSAYQGGMGFDPLRDAVEFHESRNNPNAVSPAGAVGRMQTMPDTLTDPGYGVQPARDQSDAERTRVGNEYLQAMLQKYGDPSLALAAYNAGPGRVDQALQQAGGDPQRALSMLPQETQQYVPRVLASAGGQGGPVSPQAAPGGAIPVPGFRGAPKGGANRVAPLSAEEVASLGLPAGTVAERNEQTGAIRVIHKPEGPKPPSAAELKTKQNARAMTENLSQIEQLVGTLEQANDVTGKFELLNTPAREKYAATVQQLSVLLKPLIRGPGEGPWTDKDQENLERLLPKLNNYESTNETVNANLRNFINSRRKGLGISDSAPDDDDENLIRKYL